MYLHQNQTSRWSQPTFFYNESPTRVRENDTTRSKLFHKADSKYEYQTFFQGYNHSFTPANNKFGLKCPPKKDHKPEHFYATNNEDVRSKLKTQKSPQFEPKFKELSPAKLRKQESLAGLETKQAFYGENTVTQSLSKLDYPKLRTSEDKRVKQVYSGKQNFLNTKYLEPTDRMKNLQKRLSQKK